MHYIYTMKNIVIYFLRSLHPIKHYNGKNVSYAKSNIQGVFIWTFSNEFEPQSIESFFIIIGGDWKYAKDYAKNFAMLMGPKTNSTPAQLFAFSLLLRIKRFCHTFWKNTFQFWMYSTKICLIFQKFQNFNPHFQ